MIVPKFCLIIFAILLICIYIYVKKENFYITSSGTPNTTSPQNPQTTAQLPISAQLRSEIARVLGVSALRIYDLKYEGDLVLNSLNVSFEILDANVNQSVLNEISKDDADKLAQNLLKNDNFFIKINNKTIIIRYIQEKESKGLSFFDNEGLKEIVKYANDTYISVPNDESLTKFYTLGFDDNYNLIPKI